MFVSRVTSTSACAESLSGNDNESHGAAMGSMFTDTEKREAAVAQCHMAPKPTKVLTKEDEQSRVKTNTKENGNKNKKMTSVFVCIQSEGCTTALLVHKS